MLIIQFSYFSFQKIKQQAVGNGIFISTNRMLTTKGKWVDGVLSGDFEQTIERYEKIEEIFPLSLFLFFENKFI